MNLIRGTASVGGVQTRNATRKCLFVLVHSLRDITEHLN